MQVYIKMDNFFFLLKGKKQKSKGTGHRQKIKISLAQWETELSQCSN